MDESVQQHPDWTRMAGTGRLGQWLVAAGCAPVVGLGLIGMLVALGALSVLAGHFQGGGTSPGVSSRSLDPTHTAIGHPNQMIKPWISDIHTASQATGVPADWIAAEMIHESGGQAGAGNLAGAYGLMQLEPGILGATTADRMNPAANVLYGAKLLASNYSLYHSWRLASAAYYGGAGTVNAALARHGLQVPVSWAQAQGALNVIPYAQYGNTLTLAQYAAAIYAIDWQLGGKG